MGRQSTTGKLSALAIKNAIPKDKPYKISDGAGLYLLIKPNGSRYWRLGYRLHKKQKTFALGVYPNVSLAQARSDTNDARRLIAQGVDPTSHRKQQKALQQESTFNAIATEWHEKESGRWSEIHAKKIWRTIKADVLPKLGDIPIENISAQHCLAVVRKVEERDALDVASRIKQRMDAIFRYAIYTGRLTHNPVDALKDVIKTRKVTHRKALSTKELPAFLGDLEKYQGYELTKLGLKLLLLTFVRPGELRKAKWDEIDIEACEWRIPAERMKMREEHIVPLSNQALVVLEKIRIISGKHDLIFPGSRDWRKPMSENTLNHAIQKRMKYDATSHGFRSTASTYFNEKGFRSEVIERQLAHAERNKVRAAYNRSQYLAERQAMMQEWADYLDKLKARAEVIPINQSA